MQRWITRQADLPNTSRIVASRRSKSTGFVRCREKPAARERRTSSSIPNPLSAIP